MEELSDFEELIVDSLTSHYNQTLGNAYRILYKYLPVIRLLGDAHDTARIQAGLYLKNDEDGMQPDQWVEHILKTNKIYEV